VKEVGCKPFEKKVKETEKLKQKAMNEMQHQWKKKTEPEDLQEDIFHRAGAT
jgi:hypothetical protein